MKNTTTTMPTLKVGNEVRWTSQAGGVAKTKRGKIIGMIAAGKTPATTKFPKLNANGKARKITSFIIEANGKHYWPHVSLLKKV